MKLYQNTILLVYLASSFYIDDTDHFKFLNITAAPSSFGFSIAKGLEIFPNYSYPRCEHKLELGRISMDFDKNNLHMDCKYPNQPYYVLGPDKQVTIATPLQSLNFLKPKSLQNGCEKIEEFHEFAIGACQNQSITDLLYLNPRFNKTAYYQALKRSKKIHQKPMLILYLVPDSFSRRHFYRKLNSTISYFTHLSQNSDYKVYDFKLHNIIGADTSGNMMRIFGDK